MIKLSLRDCENITLSQETSANLKIYSNIMNSLKIKSDNSLLKFPNVEYFTLTGDFQKK